MLYNPYMIYKNRTSLVYSSLDTFYFPGYLRYVTIFAFLQLQVEVEFWSLKHYNSVI